MSLIICFNQFLGSHYSVKKNHEFYVSDKKSMLILFHFQAFIEQKTQHGIKIIELARPPAVSTTNGPTQNDGENNYFFLCFRDYLFLL